MESNAKVFEHLDTLYDLSLKYESLAFSVLVLKDNHFCLVDIHIQTTITKKFGEDT